MKTFLITQYGKEEIEYIRQVVVEVPDNFDETNSIHLETLEQILADQAAEADGNVWDESDSTGIGTDRIDVEGTSHAFAIATPAEFTWESLEALGITEGGAE